MKRVISKIGEGIWSFGTNEDSRSLQGAPSSAIDLN